MRLPYIKLISPLDSNIFSNKSKGICMQPLRVVVLAGGSSAERTVSLASGAAVAEALARCGHAVQRYDPLDDEFTRIDWSAHDVAFIALHGEFGEDGKVQHYLDEQQIPYTGSDAAASKTAFSKIAAKQCFRAAIPSIPTPPEIIVSRADNVAALLQQSAPLAFPLVVKPDKQGSSLGVSIVANMTELPAAITEALEFDECCLVEQMIIGTEWTVGLIDNRPLPVIQLKTGHQFFDYQAKYEDETTRYLFETDFPDDVTAHISAVGLAAAQAVGTRGIARVDIMLDEQHQPWVLEVNTIPGMTSHSLVPKAALQAGISFSQLCEQAVNLAIEGEVGRHC